MHYYVNEGNKIGGQEPQALGADQKRITASAEVVKGNVVEVTGDWTVGPAADDSTAVAGIAFNDAKVGEEVVIDTEGFVKLQASAAVIAAGASVVSAGNGKVKTKGASAGDVIGKVIAGCAADGVCYVKLK